MNNVVGRLPVTLETDSPVPLGVLLRSQHTAPDASANAIAAGPCPIYTANPAVIAYLILAFKPNDGSPLLLIRCHDTMLPYRHDT